MLITREHARSRAKWWLDIFTSSTDWSVRVREFAEDSLTDLLLSISRESQDAETDGEVRITPTTPEEG